jgi:hypothetical protein
MSSGANPYARKRVSLTNKSNLRMVNSEEADYSSMMTTSPQKPVSQRYANKNAGGGTVGYKHLQNSEFAEAPGYNMRQPPAYNNKKKFAEYSSGHHQYLDQSNAGGGGNRKPLPPMLQKPTSHRYGGGGNGGVRVAQPRTIRNSIRGGLF